MMSNVSFKSSVNAICVWWLVSVGLSAILYLLHSLISHVLHLWKCKPKRIAPNDKDDYTLNFDDVISSIEGKLKSIFH